MIAALNENFKKELRELYSEGNQLLAIIVASVNTAHSNLIKEGSKKIKNQKPKITN